MANLERQPEERPASTLASDVDVDGQLLFSDLIKEQQREQNALALFARPDDDQAKAIVRRIRIFRKWEEEQNV